MKYCRTTFTLSVWILLLLLSSCTHLFHVEQARESFNRGARMENRARLNVENRLSNLTAPAAIADSITNEFSPEFFYNQANAELNRALRFKGKLRNDGALSTALTLKALCEWKLNLHDQAVNTSAEALSAIRKSNVRMPRDEAMMVALSGLISNDVAYDSSESFKAYINREAFREDLSPADTAEIRNRAQEHYRLYIFDPAPRNGNIERALQKLEEARRVAGRGHPVQSYLVVSELIGMKTWLGNLETIENSVYRKLSRNDDSFKAWLGEEVDRYNKNRREYLDHLARVLRIEKLSEPQRRNENELYKDWADRLPEMTMI